MDKTSVIEKVNKLESDLRIIKKALGERPDFSVDEKIWETFEPTIRRVRKKLYKEEYGKS